MEPSLLLVETGDVERGVRDVVQFGGVLDLDVPGHMEPGETLFDGSVDGGQHVPLS